MIPRNKRLGTSLNDKAAILALDTLLLNFINTQEKYTALFQLLLYVEYMLHKAKPRDNELSTKNWALQNRT